MANRVANEKFIFYALYRQFVKEIGGKRPKIRILWIHFLLILQLKKIWPGLSSRKFCEKSKNVNVFFSQSWFLRHFDVKMTSFSGILTILTQKLYILSIIFFEICTMNRNYLDYLQGHLTTNRNMLKKITKILFWRHYDVIMTSFSSFSYYSLLLKTTNSSSS